MTPEAFGDWEARPGWSPSTIPLFAHGIPGPWRRPSWHVTLPIFAMSGFSPAYAFMERAGKRVPHPRHYAALVKLAGVETLPSGIASLMLAEMEDRP